MEPCPNCQTPTRAGAKFCTTCGYRISDPPTPVAPWTVQKATVSGQPEATVDAEATVEPEARVEAPGDASGAELDTGVAAEPAAEPAVDPPMPAWGASPSLDEPAALDPLAEPAPTPDDQVLSSSWPAPSAAAWPSGWGAIEPSAAAVDEPADATDDADGDGAADAGADDTKTGSEGNGEVPTWPSFSPEAGAGGEPAEETGEEVGEAADAGFLSANDGDADPETDTDVSDPIELEGPTPDAVERSPADAFPPEVASPTPNAGTDTAEGSDPAARAATLVDELRDLLPMLAPAPAPDAESIARDLDEALASDPWPADDLTRLRDAATSARDRPRDLDALVALAAEAPLLLAVLDQHDRLAEAADRARAALRVPEEGAL